MNRHGVALLALGFACALFVGQASAQNMARGRISSAGGGSAVVGPATGPGTDTCTGNGCAIGPSGISTDGGVSIAGGGGIVVSEYAVDGNGINFGTLNGWHIGNSGTGSTSDFKFKAAASVYGTWSYSTGFLTVVYGVNSPTFNATTGIQLNAAPTFVVAAPSLTFGGTGASITGTGTSFVVNVGTGAPGSSGTLTFATTATNGYNCMCVDETASPLTQTKMSSDTTTTCVITNYTVATGSAANWAASDKIHCIAAAY